jgi:hypothetical protein
VNSYIGDHYGKYTDTSSPEYIYFKSEDSKYRKEFAEGNKDTFQILIDHGIQG